MRLFRFLLRLAPGTVALAVLCGLLSGACSAALLGLVGASLAGGRLSADTLVAAFVALCVVTPLTRFAADYLLSRLGQGCVYDLRMSLSRRILGAPLRHLEEIGAPRMLATLTEDIAVIINALLYIPLLCINVAIVAGCVVYLGWLSPVLLALVLGFMLVGAVTYQIPIMAGTRMQRLAREGADSLYGHFRALTSGTKELKLDHRRREAFLNEVLGPTASSMRRLSVRAMAYFIAAGSWGQVLFFTFTGCVLIVLPRFAVLGPEVTAAGVVAVLYMMNPLDSLMNSLSTLNRANVALAKVESLGLSLDARDTVPGATPHAPDVQRWRSLQLVGVTHAYHRERENDDFTLGPIDISLSPGEIIFVVGGNGSGKTTLLKLLTGLYAPESGEIRLDGRPVTAENVEQYRQHFSVVFSDFYLFESLLGADGPDVDERAREYLSQLHLSHKVSVEGGVLSTTELSQGQRKRLALLAAYLEDRPVYVFDEWAADQDPLFKDVFYRRLLPELRARGKTLVVITHDDKYYDEADRVVKLESGRVEYDKQLVPLSRARIGAGR
jgi:putative ATP-binding cassette transporter